LAPSSEGESLPKFAVKREGGSWEGIRTRMEKVVSIVRQSSGEGGHINPSSGPLEWGKGHTKEDKDSSPEAKRGKGDARGSKG